MGLTKKDGSAGLPLIVLGGERTPSAELMECSTVPIGLAAQAHSYLAEGGPANLAQLHAFLCDTVLLTGEGFDEPVVIPDWGYADRPTDLTAEARIGVLYYRAHEVSGNTAFAHALADAIDAAARSASRSSRPRCAAHPTNCSTRSALSTPSWSRVLAAGGTQARPPPVRAETTRRGTSSASPRSTSRSCRGCA